MGRGNEKNRSDNNRDYGYIAGKDDNTPRFPKALHLGGGEKRVKCEKNDGQKWG